MKAYTFYNLQTKVIFISRDAVFHEDIYPFHAVTDPDLIIDPFLDLVLPLIPNLEPPAYSSPPSSSTTSDIPPSSPTVPAPNDTVAPPIRKSTRSTKPPGYLRNYHHHLLHVTDSSNIHSTTPFPRYPITNYISYTSLSPQHRHFALTVSSHIEPSTYHEAQKSQAWCTAMQNELDAMATNNTWTVTPLPPGKHTVGCKWTYRIKYDANGNVERYKARLVAKGYTQQEGLDFSETYSPVAKLVTVKTLLAVAAAHNWNLLQLDINNAFLHGDLFEEVYMDLPLGYQPPSSPTSTSRFVCRLNKSIYDLKQASRQWYLKFSHAILQLGFTTLCSLKALAMRSLPYLCTWMTLSSLAHQCPSSQTSHTSSMIYSN